ncbi:hypothetical protein ACWCPQ_14860 [Nocardia sp. NPDC001965]
MIAGSAFRSLAVVASTAAAAIAVSGLAGAAVIPPSTATLTVSGATVTASLSRISTDLVGGTVQCALLIDGDPQQNALSARESAPADFALYREVAAGDHLAVSYCADYPAGSDTPSSYPTLACAKVSVPAATVEALPNDRCYLPGE